MPSQLHEALLLLFRNQPTLAKLLLRDALCPELSLVTQVFLQPADLTDIQPTEYRADLVIVLNDTGPHGTRPVMGIVLEVQLAVDERKKWVWPVYAATLRARLRCPVCLLVVTANERVARWAAVPIEIGGGNWFTPYVLGPSSVPQITDESQARENPELVVLSALVHGKSASTDTSVRIALAAHAAIADLEADRASLYYDLLMSALNDAAREVLKTMDMSKYQYQSDFARQYHSQGIAEGLARGEQQGRAALLTKQLSMRFGSLTPETQARIVSASIPELEFIAERVLTAATLEEALGSK